MKKHTSPSTSPNTSQIAQNPSSTHSHISTSPTSSHTQRITSPQTQHTITPQAQHVATPKKPRITQASSKMPNISRASKASTPISIATSFASHLAQNPSAKALYLDKEAISSLAIVQEGLLAPISHLANQRALEHDEDGFFTPFILSPAGKRNHAVMQSLQPNDFLHLVLEGNIVGHLHVEEVFPINRAKRTFQLTGLSSGAEFDGIYARLGDYAVCGDYHVAFPDIIHAKASLEQQIKEHSAQHITGLVLDGRVFHLAYEALIKDALSLSDLVVLFLLKPYRDTTIPYDVQKSCVEFAMQHFLINERVCIIPLDDTYLFMGTNNILLYAMVAKNYGCTHFIIQDNAPHLSGLYEHDILHSVLDMAKGIKTSIKGGYVYCNICSMLIPRTTCPHGKHHHINYDTKSIMEFFTAGLPPPSVLVRKEISAKLLAYLFPNRFTHLQSLYYNLMPLGDGVLSVKSEEDFYLDLLRLYALHT